MYHKEELSRALAQASAQKSRAGALRIQLRDLDAQLETLTAREAELARQRDKEQADVDALEGNGLAALFYAAIGRREEKLDREKAEAYQAAAHHDAARMQLANAQQEREVRQAELDRLGDVDARYEAAYRAKLNWLRQNDPVNGAEIARLEAEKLACDDRRREIAEAIAAGRAACDLADEAGKELSSAENWGMWDVFGGGLFADMIKHEKLQNAQSTIYSLQSALSGLRTELADVERIDADLNVTVDGFMNFADYFFDGLFADWTVLNRIRDSLSSIGSVCANINSVIWKLEELDETEVKKQNSLREQLDRLVKTE